MPSFSTFRVWSANSIHRSRSGSITSSGAAELPHFSASVIPPRLYSARNARDLDAGLRQPPISSMPVQYATPVAEDRAVEVLRLLADRGHHRAPSVPDLLIAATAESAGLVVLHDHKDFHLIAQITGQPVERLT
jgi:predicted nucleic acid-binding protein